MKRIKPLLCLLLCAVLLLAGASYGTSADASELTNDSIREKENQIKEAQSQRDQINRDLTNVKKLKEELEKSRSDLNAYVKELDTQLGDIQAKISQLKQMIAEKEADIVRTTAELDEAIDVQKAQYEAMKKRIKFMYEKSGTIYLEVVFSSASFGEMLNKADYVEKILDYDRKKLDEYVATREYIELCKMELEEEKQVLEEARAAVEAEENNLEILIGEKKNRINEVSADIQTKEQAIAEYEADIQEQNDTIAALEKAVAEEKARLAAANARRYDGGMFAWPAPSYTRISDDYGNRMHPTLQIEKFHNGIDMAAPGGSPILAAYNGTVVAADYNGSMGNYIMIDHGDGLYTIYMHASALYVSKGAEVSKGQSIAAVGSTGRSTGNHLHFSVRLNGNYVSPWRYLGK